MAEPSVQTMPLLMRTGSACCWNSLVGQPSLEVDDFDKLRFSELHRLRSIIKAATPDCWRREPNGFMKLGERYMALVDAQEAKRLRTQHRALPDADSLWRRWSAIKEWVDQQSPPPLDLYLL